MPDPEGYPYMRLLPHYVGGVVVVNLFGALCVYFYMIFYVILSFGGLPLQEGFTFLFLVHGGGGSTLCVLWLGAQHPLNGL